MKTAFQKYKEYKADGMAVAQELNDRFTRDKQEYEEHKAFVDSIPPYLQQDIPERPNEAFSIINFVVPTKDDECDKCHTKTRESIINQVRKWSQVETVHKYLSLLEKTYELYEAGLVDTANNMRQNLLDKLHGEYTQYYNYEKVCIKKRYADDEQAKKDAEWEEALSTTSYASSPGKPNSLKRRSNSNVTENELEDEFPTSTL